jgi:hypothetical protein
MITGHYTIVGRTGSGKSVAAAQHLVDWHTANPNGCIVVINPKASKMWDGFINPTTKPKVQKGALINYHVLPHQKYEVNEVLWDVYEKAAKLGKTLVILDEGQNYTDTAYPAAAALWTQGREKGIEVVTCCQRPSRISISAITQVSYLRIYNVIGSDDLKKLDEYMESPITQYITAGKMKNGEVVHGSKLKPYESAVYDVASGELVIRPPVQMVEPFKLLPPKPKFKPIYALSALMALGFLIK